jgi:LysR family glycine cleavage system transcriptional activator
MHRLNRVPLRALRAVETVARLGSLAKAAEELHVSPGAVSQQITSAEATLGMMLFERGPRGMTPALRAKELCALLTSGFSQLSQAIALAEENGEEVLTISVAPVFASRWLIWRLPAFQSLYPEVKVRFDASVLLVDPRHGDVDLCIRVGRGNWPGVSTERLFSQVVFPVCAPTVAKNIATVTDLARTPIIREPHPNFDWDAWLLPGEIDPGSLPSGPVFSDASLCLDAAISGSGVFLTFETLAADALTHGRLVEPFRRRRATRNAYWFVSPEGRPRRPVKLFRDWLKQEVASAGFGNERSEVPLVS